MIETISKVTTAGDVYGRLTVLGTYRDDTSRRHLHARVQCSCGSPPRYVRLDTLRNGTSQSCGCLQKESTTKHGFWGKPLFGIWRAMISRCTNPLDKRFDRYGGRGITVCVRWLDVGDFIADMSPSYSKGMTLDRRDNDGNYDPDNCRWATAKQQTRNYSRNVVLEHDGQRLCVVDWSVLVGIPSKTLYDRVKRGWSARKALTTPVKQR